MEKEYTISRKKVIKLDNMEEVWSLITRESVKKCWIYISDKIYKKIKEEQFVSDMNACKSSEVIALLYKVIMLEVQNKYDVINRWTRVKRLVNSDNNTIYVMPENPAGVIFLDLEY